MKKFLITFLFLLMAVVPAMAQIKDSDAADNQSYPYQLVEVKPTFDGGDIQAFVRFVYSQFDYPEEARKEKIQGRVIVTFIVETDGSVSNVNVIKGVHPLLDAEAKRVISDSPKWTPGAIEGKPVRVSLSVPFIFKIQAEEEEPKEEVTGDAIPYKIVEKKPTFKGGDANEFSRWVNSRLIIPESVREKIKRGAYEWRVILQFTIETDGRVTDVKILKSSGEPEIDFEALKVVSSSPKWNPGFQGDRPVKVTYTFPVIMSIRIN